jgi:AcrR family transcriptional regulator
VTARADAASPPPYAEATRDLLHTRVLDAVGELLLQRPWSEVRMSDVAERAGVSRQTLYNGFGSRADLAQAYVTREAEAFLVTVDAAVREHSAEPREALAAALEVFLGAAETHPLIRAIASSDGGEELLPLVTTRGGPVVGMVTDRLTAVLCDVWPALKAADAALVSDTLARLAISHAALPSDSPRATAAATARLLGPSLDQLLER